MLPVSVAFTVASSANSVASSSTPVVVAKGSVAASKTQLDMVTTTAPTAPVDMERGIGGRIEDAFQSAKERGEAAFVAFITAGYPAKEGETKLLLEEVVLQAEH